MDFELEHKIQIYLNEDKIEQGIQLVESELKKYSDTKFSHMIGLDLLHQSDGLMRYLDGFIEKLNNKISLKSMYAEMNGFSINYGLWYIDFFGFDFIGSMDDLDWLADWETENASETEFVVTGFEKIQETYRDYDENELWKDRHLQKAAEIIILRLQELFKKTIENAKLEEKEWAELPILVTAHDYELIYRKN